MWLERCHLVQRRAHDQLEAQASPRLHGAAGELGIGLDETFVEEDRREPGAGPQFVTETESQCRADDERHQFLALAAALAAERGVSAEKLSGGVVPFGGDLDVAPHVEQSVAVAELGDRARVVPAAEAADELCSSRKRCSVWCSVGLGWRRTTVSVARDGTGLQRWGSGAEA